MNNKIPTIIIEVVGGCVSYLYSDSPVKCIIVDQDNLEEIGSKQELDKYFKDFDTPEIVNSEEINNIINKYKEDYSQKIIKEYDGV